MNGEMILAQNIALRGRRLSFRQRVVKDLRINWPLYFLVSPVVLYYIVFHYWPIYGVQIAFRDFKITRGFFGSPWVGLKHFIRFFQNPYTPRIIRNTFLMNIYGLLFGFPAPLLFALMLNEVYNSKFKRLVQTLSYLPHFISLVVICGMITQFCLTDGLFNRIIVFFGGQRIPLLLYEQYYRTIYIGSGIWQGLGWGSIIYIAAISGVDQELYEAAYIDGAGRFQRMWHITIASILPTILMLLILNVGSLMGMGAEKTLLLYQPSTYEVSDVISSFIYRMGLGQQDWSFGSAVGLLNSVVNVALLVIANQVSKKVSETSLW